VEIEIRQHLIADAADAADAAGEAVWADRMAACSRWPTRG
jgi:hypothetical protein